MKSRIDFWQLLELESQQQDKLRDLWNPQIGDLFRMHGLNHLYDGEDVDNSNIFLEERKPNALPLLDIGQCINILYNYSCDTEIVGAGAKWYVNCAGHINEEGSELIDVLYKALKHIL